jgi:PAS domain S-box-containing protein
MVDSAFFDANFSRALLDTVGALVTVLDLEGRFVSFNRACELLSGYSFEEVRGRSYTMFLLPEEAPEIAQVIEQLAEGVPARHQNYWVTRAGERRWIDWTNTFMRDAEGRVQYLLATGIDQTEQKIKEQAVIDSERRFSLFFELNPIASSVLLLDGTIVAVNTSLEKLLGYPRSELIGKRIGPPGTAPFYFEIFELDEAALYAGMTVQGEVQMVNASGQTLFLMVYLVRVNMNGQDCLFSTLQDFSERKLYEEKILLLNEDLEQRVQERSAALSRELHERVILQEKLNLLVRVSPVVILSTLPVPPFTISYVSENFESIFKIRVSEILNSVDFWIKRVHPDDYSRIMDNISLDYSGREVVYEVRFLAGDNTWRWVHAEGRLVRDSDGRPLEMYASLQDITQRRTYEEAIRVSEERYRSLAEAAHDFIFVISADGLVEYVNSYGARILGLKPEEVIGKPRSLFFPRDHSDYQRNSLSQVAALGKTVYFEALTPFPGGDLWLGTRLVPISDDNGQVIAVLGVSRDITERKRNEEELQRAFRAEKELNELRSNFVSMITHQMGTPLSAILSSAELLEHYAEHWPAERREKHLRRIIESTQRLDQMNRDILNLGRVNATLASSRPVPLDFTRFCLRLVEMFQTSDRGQHEIVFTKAAPFRPGAFSLPQIPASGPEDQALWGWGDENLLMPMLENLISNGLKYSPEHSRVELGLSLDEGWLAFWVRDEGMGIPADDHHRLGVAFYRGKNVSRTPGTGLGLALVKQTLEALGGTWKIDSVENVGTTVHLRLPFRPAEPPGVGGGDGA